MALVRDVVEILEALGALLLAALQPAAQDTSRGATAGAPIPRAGSEKTTTMDPVTALSQLACAGVERMAELAGPAGWDDREYQQRAGRAVLTVAFFQAVAEPSVPRGRWRGHQASRRRSRGRGDLR